MQKNGVDQWQDCQLSFISFDEEPAYKDLSGKWPCIQPYVVVHRLALGNAFKGLGLCAKVFRLVEEMSVKRCIHSFKIDTDVSGMDSNQ